MTILAITHKLKILTGYTITIEICRSRNRYEIFKIQRKITKDITNILHCIFLITKISFSNEITHTFL